MVDKSWLGSLVYQNQLCPYLIKFCVSLACLSSQILDYSAASLSLWILYRVEEKEGWLKFWHKETKLWLHESLDRLSLALKIIAKLKFYLTFSHCYHLSLTVLCICIFSKSRNIYTREWNISTSLQRVSVYYCTCVYINSRRSFIKVQTDHVSI